ncbi:flavin reductase family protein [Corynebacterium durum]|jgi:oxidoreductase|uniref:Flavin reductase-like protein n=1 Tax=Corynebacterium durum F0235 TaxID=1035195 RepID=L1MEW4_9CORY|nr:flavin reductase family protein [Corynebacterium durum]EKX89499.1 flavin reductase-like protein [Corynebacterium durum F0235]NYI73885.1 flavin reductase (DIM6/NTAB) family NADH-FMN oxidoreductase RutF [Corynebacterium durum]WJY85608.1 p-hydroxyphenylacetate 3-hydroxylase, reductase component [Corynebacterium durum]
MSQPTSTHYRETVANFPSGVTVVTTRDGGEDFGLTVSAFTSLSLDPPMVLVSIDRKSKSHQHLVEGAPIGISVLAAGHTDVAVQFARHVDDRFAGINIVRRGEQDIPFVGDAAAWFLGDVRDRYVGGDHIIITVAVRECGWHDGGRPLLYRGGRLHNWPDVLG